MIHRNKLVLVAALAIVALSAFASAASATSISLSAGGNITSASLGKLTFHGIGIGDVLCNVSLMGTLAKGPIAETAGNAFGSITSVTTANCTGTNTNPVILNLPWTLKYASELLSGTTLTGILFTINTAAFLITPSLINQSCLYAGAAGALVSVTGTANPFLTGLISSLGTSLPLQPGSGGSCPATGSLLGTFGLTPQQSVWRI